MPLKDKDSREGILTKIHRRSIAMCDGPCTRPRSHLLVPRLAATQQKENGTMHYITKIHRSVKVLPRIRIQSVIACSMTKCEVDELLLKVIPEMLVLHKLFPWDALVVNSAGELSELVGPSGLGSTCAPLCS